LKQTVADLRKIFRTEGLVVPMAGSGTLGAEISLANIIEPDDDVLAISGGYFGDRLSEIAVSLGANVDRMQVDWGSVVDPVDVGKKLSSKNYKALLVVHVDTSTGAANPVRDLGRIARERNVLFLVDAVCSLGGMEFDMDSWGVDVCFTGSQKALASPPGLTIAAFGSRAISARDQRKSRMSAYYGDLKRWAPVIEDPTKYFATHAVNMIYGLNQSCKMILQEGLTERFARHAKIASAFRSAMKTLGLRVLCAEKNAANTLTVSYYPDNVRDVEFRATVNEKFGIDVAGGLGPLKGSTFRVGHMGGVNRQDLIATVGAVEGALLQQGYNFTEGSGIGAALKVLT
jgi:aspartate aminotransferase-like enzyme